MSTFGQVRLRLRQQFENISLDLLDGWIIDRYTQILDRLTWIRRQVDAVLQTTAVYETGTVEVTNGSTAVTGTLTVWTAAMTGYLIRIGSDAEYYTFTRTGDTTGTLDRAYEGTTDTDATYKIFRALYALPAACRVLGDIRSFSDEVPLTKVSLAQLHDMAPNRNTFGSPACYAIGMDDNSTPPQMQVEFWPIPDTSVGLPYTYTAESTLTGDTSVTLLPWVRPRALVEGVAADIYRFQEKPVMYQIADSEYEKAMGDMLRTECANTPSQQMQLPSEAIAHRVRRWTR